MKHILFSIGLLIAFSTVHSVHCMEAQHKVLIFYRTPNEATATEILQEGLQSQAQPVRADRIIFRYIPPKDMLKVAPGIWKYTLAATVSDRYIALAVDPNEINTYNNSFRNSMIITREEALEPQNPKVAQERYEQSKQTLSNFLAKHAAYKKMLLANNKSTCSSLVLRDPFTAVPFITKPQDSRAHIRAWHYENEIPLEKDMIASEEFER